MPPTHRPALFSGYRRRSERVGGVGGSASVGGSVGSVLSRPILTSLDMVVDGDNCILRLYFSL
jgi:hypothetical protein